ncbi:MAG: hypothetical protein ACK40K_06640 [Raineya sp.]
MQKYAKTKLVLDGLDCFFSFWSLNEAEMLALSKAEMLALSKAEMPKRENYRILSIKKAYLH